MLTHALCRLGMVLLVAAFAGACARGAPGTAVTSNDGLTWPSSAARGPAEAGNRDGPSIKVLTYNVNYGLGGDPAGVDAIARADADLVLLQETTPAWAAALRSRLVTRYPHMAFRDCCGAGGLGVLSKHPFVEKDYAHAPTGWFPAWRLLVDSPLGQLQVLSVHLHPQISDSGSVVSGHFSTPAIRQAEITEYYALLDPALPTLVAGDFNEDRGGPAIEYLQQRGFRSAQSEVASSEPTWYWRTSVGTIHAEFDHLMHDARLEPLEVRVLDAGRSDHYPVLGVFRLTRSATRSAPGGGST